MVTSDLDDRPLDRALFAAFAELVQARGNGPVADVGCATGKVTLRRWIDAGTGRARGWPRRLLAYYSIIHIARERRREIFAEFHRVLAPGGVLMLVFQIGDEQGHRTDFCGTPVSVDWYRQRPDDLANLLREASFELWATAVRQPEGNEPTAQVTFWRASRSRKSALDQSVA